ncbi:MAG: hypothetical protein LBN18_02725 [Dysgonamonadaceae bacterium]|jgi:hypothetical protein|nr:hypothetical protein [Dysgonamonadaceae bacterium]
MKKHIALLSFMCFCFAFSSCKQNKIGLEKSLDKSIALSINYIKENTLQDGRFVYRRHANPDIEYANTKYNVLRHAGTLYSMYLCERVLQDSTLREERLRASDYLVENYVQQIDSARYSVVSKGEEEGEKNDSTAKLGAAGLSLIALSNLYPEGKVDLKLLRGLGNFIIYLQDQDGNFAANYSLKTHSIDNSFYSLYYPGEAALGLLYLYEFDPQPQWLDAAKKALLYLSDSRKDKGSNVEFDHWALLATRKLFETPTNGLTPTEKSFLQKHAEQIANSVLSKKLRGENDPYYGALESNIRPCSIGTIMEGLVAVYYITENEELKLKVYDRLEKGTSFLSHSQIKTGEMAGGLPTSADWTLPKSKKNAGVIRIDNVQHVLSAWITFCNLKKNTYFCNQLDRM